MGRNSTLDLAIALATAWYALRLLRPQVLLVATLWALPALMVAVCAWQYQLFTGAAPGPLALAGLGGALAGLAVGHLTFRSADVRAGRVVVQGTPLSVLLWPGAIVLALAARYALGGGAGPTSASPLDVALLTRAGLPDIRFHDLWHSCASLLIAQGIPARTIMETPGHSQISLTMDTYAHVFADVQRQAADAMDRLFGVAVGAD